MTEVSAPLVAGDTDEIATRATYAPWIAHALETARTLAAEPRRDETAPQGAAPPSGPEQGLTRSAPTSRSRGALGVKDAQQRGWLTYVAPEHGQAPPRGPLHGLAVSVKDIVDVAGMPTRNGTPSALWREPVESATVWERLHADGARCIGKSATHEMAWGITTPQIPHPVDPDRSAGGSSGGAAASIAAGVCDGGIGTDTGGSVRVPAALCGVVGFRPTWGTAPTDGITPLAPLQDVPGPLAHDVPTALAMLESLTGRPMTPADADVDGLRIGFLRRTGRLQPAVDRGYRDALGRLEMAGATLVPVETDVLRHSTGISLLTMLRASARLHATTVRADPSGFGGAARALLTLGEPLAEHASLIAAARAIIVDRTEQVFSAHRLDAFITPTTTCAAPGRRAAAVTVGGCDEPVSAALTRFTAWASVTGMPALSMPAGADEYGLAVGIQIMAPPHHEPTCARLALAYETLNPAKDRT